MNILVKHWPYILIAVGFIGGLYKDIQDDKQQDKIENTGVETKAISKEVKRLQDVNQEVTANIKKSSDENVKLTSNNLDLAEKTKVIIEENLNLTNKAKELTENVEKITFQVNNLLKIVRSEITGGNSIPIVNANLFFNPFDPMQRYTGMQPPEEYNKWLIDFTIKNTGEFKLTNIRFYQTKNGWNLYPTRPQLQTVDVLSSGETKQLYDRIIVNDDNGQALLNHKIKVEWKLATYTYFVTFSRDGNMDPISHKEKWEYKKREHYEYKKIKYETAEEMEKSIKIDLESGN